MQLVDNQQLIKRAVMRFATGSGGTLPQLASLSGSIFDT